LFPLFCEASVYFAPFVLTFAVFSVVYASFTTLIQVDMKKLVAYSSVAHMNFVVLGLFVFNSQGFLGSIILMLSHGLVSSALFICVGFLYERYKVRSLLYISGLGRLLPFFSFLFFIFTLGNMGFPGTFSFIGEFLILLGVFLKNSVVGVLAGLSVIFSAGYSLILYSYTFHGSIRFNMIKYFSDLSHREFMILFVLAL
jgi:NADH:ubiquinone oxidoreductase subunit 4 (subunit M)